MTHIVPKIAVGQAITMNATQLNGLPSSYYLDCNNFINCPTSILDFNITDGQPGDILVTDGSGNFSFQPLVYTVVLDGGGAANINMYGNSNIDGVNAAAIYTKNQPLNFNAGTA